MVNIITYVQRALSKTKPLTKIVGIEEKQNAKATIFSLRQQEQFADEMKYLKIEIEVPKNSKIVQFSLFIDQRDLTSSFQRQIRQNQLDFFANHPKLFQLKHHVVELFLRNEHKYNKHEGTEHVRNIFQQRF